VSAYLLIDVGHNDAGGSTLKPQTATSTATGTAVDMQLADGPVNALLTVGTVSGTTPTCDVKLQESDDGSTNWTDITGAAFTQVKASDARQWVQALRSKRYVRALATIAGTMPSFALAVELVGQAKVVGTGGGYTSSPQS
jgi:hypothetical protein